MVATKSGHISSGWLRVQQSSLKGSSAPDVIVRQRSWVLRMKMEVRAADTGLVACLGEQRFLMSCSVLQGL